MFRLLFTPEWFSGWDLVFNAVSLLVALFIAGYSWRVYRLHKENKYAYFSLAFLLISLAFIFKIVAQSPTYFTSVRDAVTVTLLPVIGRSAGIGIERFLLKSSFFLSMISTLGAWLLIFFISQKKRDRLKRYYEVSQIALFVYLIVLISFVSNFQYFVFYLTSAVILGLVVLNYYKNYLNTNKSKNAFKVMWAFLFILIGQFAYIFVFLKNWLYVFGEVFTLLGFLMLLYVYRKVTKKKFVHSLEVSK
tara:strand:+ start:346 stop:1089 length:744 start_codon:yes stop_codon:yes gene_type:complete